MYTDGAEQAHIEQTEYEISEHQIKILNAVEQSLIKLQLIRDALDETAFQKGMRKGKEVLKVKRNNRQLLFEAYQAIQHIREEITGQVLTYHLYVTLPDNSLMGISLGSEELRQYLSFEGTEIRIAQNKIKQALKNPDNIVTIADKMFANQTVGRSELYGTIMSRTELAENSRGQFLLKDESGNEWIKKRSGKGAGISPTVFNKGHIVEGIDTTMSWIQMNYDEYDIELLQVDDYISHFYEYIRQDTISGFKGGDNPFINAQVKANHAQLMAYNTIISAMDTLLSLKTALESGNIEDVAKAKDAVHALYVSSNTDAKIDQKVDKFLQDLLAHYGFG